MLVRWVRWMYAFLFSIGCLAEFGLAYDAQFGPTTLRLEKENNYSVTFPAFQWAQRGTIRISLTWHVLGQESTNVLHRAVLVNSKGVEVARVERLLNSTPAQSTMLYSLKSSDMAEPHRMFWLVRVFNVDPSQNRRTVSVTLNIRCTSVQSRDAPR